MEDLEYTPVPHDHTEFLSQARKKPGFNEAYDALAEQYEQIRKMLRAKADE